MTFDEWQAKHAPNGGAYDIEMQRAGWVAAERACADKCHEIMMRNRHGSRGDEWCDDYQGGNPNEDDRRRGKDQRGDGMTREWPETIRELVEQYASMKDENKVFRRLLAMAHDSEKHRIYGDDGELQCSACWIDFVRDSAQDIRRKLEESSMRELQRAIAAGEWPPKPATGNRSEPPTPDRRAGPPDRRWPENQNGISPNGQNRRWNIVGRRSTDKW